MVRLVRGASNYRRLFSGNAHCLVWAIVVLQVSGLATAQTTPPAKSDSEIKTPYLDNYTPSEEVKRRAMGPLRIIKQMGDQKKPAPPASTPAPVATSTPAPVAPPKPKVEETVKVEKKAPVVETPAPPPAAVVAEPAQLPAPVAAPAVPPPELPKVAKQPNLELIPVRQDAPVYNRSMMRDSVSALVKVAFDVNPDGSTSSIQVTSSNNRRLNASATDAVAKWKFRPIDDVVRVEVDISFSID